jgi:hypothetical protein
MTTQFDREAKETKMTRIVRPLVLLLGLSFAGASAAWADRDAAALTEKRSAALMLEDGTLVRVGAGTRIENEDGQKISFASIGSPSPSNQGTIWIDWEGSLQGSSVTAARIIVSVEKDD